MERSDSMGSDSEGLDSTPAEDGRSQPPERRGLRITGRVQGVGFRWFTRRTAGELGVRGSVRNRPDGSVEVHAEGPAEVLARFEERLRRGPRGARVDGVGRVESSMPVPEADFVIRR